MKLVPSTRDEFHLIQRKTNNFNKMKTSIKFLILALSVAFVSSCIEDPDDDTPPRTEAQELSQLAVYIDTLNNRGLDVDTTELGVYYIIDSLADGVYPVPGDTCIVKYEGYTLDGYMFDASARHSTDGTYEFILENPPMIEGWDDGMRVINEGSSAHLIIPSSLAYGSIGAYPAIAPYQTLIFYIEMLEIKQAY